MALYCTARTAFSYWVGSSGGYNIWKSMYVLYFTNDSTDGGWNWVEWSPSLNTFPCKDTYYPEITTTTRQYIVKVATYNDKVVVMPEDCSNLFKNMSLGYFLEDILGYQTGNSYYYKLSSSPTLYSRLTPSELYMNKFDFSNTKNISSMFENACALSTTSLSFPVPSVSSRPPAWMAVTNLSIFGLDEWDLSNVTDASRMFANFNVGNALPSERDPSKWWGATDWINTVGTYPIFPNTTLRLPKCETAENMFTNAKLNLNTFSIAFGDSVASYKNMFNGYSTTDDNNSTLNLSKWVFSTTSNNATANSMFRNINVKQLNLGDSITKLIKQTTYGSNAIDYMFATDTTTSGSLEKILVKAGTDWNFISDLDGYKMFSGDGNLPNFDPEFTTIVRANNTTSTGYFERALPEVVINNYIKLASGWKSSTVYFKTSEGWTESEVYM